MVDTFRADKMHVYNPKTRVQTPNYDAFAADATRFEWAQVPGTWSLPSHASLLTGVYPSVHKAVAHEARLSKDVPFIAEEMKKAGFETAMFSSNGYVSGKWGFERGWDAYRNFIRENLPNSADYIWKIAKPWVLGNMRKPEFVVLRHRRAARHLQPAQAVPHQVLEQTVQRADQADENRHSARLDQGRQAQDQRQRPRLSSRRCTTARSPRATRSSQRSSTT